MQIKGAFTSAIFSSPGKLELSLPDGSKIDMSHRNIEITGLLSKDKTFNIIDTMRIADSESNIVSLTTFDP